MFLVFKERKSEKWLVRGGRWGGGGGGGGGGRGGGEGEEGGVVGGGGGWLGMGLGYLFSSF